jgi:hypothetical protein
MLKVPSLCEIVFVPAFSRQMLATARGLIILLGTKLSLAFLRVGLCGGAKEDEPERKG